MIDTYNLAYIIYLIIFHKTSLIDNYVNPMINFDMIHL